MILYNLSWANVDFAHACHDKSSSKRIQGDGDSGERNRSPTVLFKVGSPPHLESGGGLQKKKEGRTCTTVHCIDCVGVSVNQDSGSVRGAGAGGESMR